MAHNRPIRWRSSTPSARTWRLPAGSGWIAASTPDRLVKTHCCFCGQQCGIQLKVKDNEVIGFEPWEEFPFNRGMLCPKGVKRYLQGSHPDRLLHAYRRDPSSASGFSPMDYDEAIRTVAEDIQRIQSAHGTFVGCRAQRRESDDRKDLLDGQVRPRVSEDANIDYNGGCAWSAPAPATRKRSASIGPRIPGPISRRPRWSGSAARTSPSAPRSRPTMSGRRGNSARRSSSSIRASRRSRAPATCFCRSSPAATWRCSTAFCSLMIEHDWLDHEFIERHTVGFEAVAEHVQIVDPERRRPK